VNVFIVSASGGQKPQFWAILDICGTPYQPPFTDEGHIWCARADRRSTLTRQISSECVHCIGFQWPKTTILGKFWLLGLLYRPPFTDERQICCTIADPRYTLTCHNSSRSVLSPSGGKKNPICAVFLKFGIYSGVASWQQSEKVEHGCTTTKLLLSNGIKMVSVVQRLHDEIGRTISDVQKRDGQTNRQTKKLNVFGRPGGGWNPSPTKLVTVIEDLEHVLLILLKLLGVWHIVSPLGALKVSG